MPTISERFQNVKKIHLNAEFRLCRMNFGAREPSRTRAIWRGRGGLRMRLRVLSEQSRMPSAICCIPLADPSTTLIKDD